MTTVLHNASCSICREPIESSPKDEQELPAELTCHHVFHNACIRPWLNRHWSCPNCRAAIIHLPTIHSPSHGLIAYEQLALLGGGAGILALGGGFVISAIKEVGLARTIGGGLLLSATAAWGVSWLLVDRVLFDRN